jgi:hypothetical protein
LIVIQGFKKESDDVSLYEYVNTIHEYLADRINKEIFKHTFDFKLGEEIKAWDSDQEEEEKRGDLNHQNRQQILGKRKRKREHKNYESGPNKR